MPSSDKDTKDDDKPQVPPPPAPPVPARPKTVVAKLRCLGHRGETVSTRWGDVVFDRDGLAELEVPEDELQMLRDVRPHSWLASDHSSYQRQLRQQQQRQTPPRK